MPNLTTPGVPWSWGNDPQWKGDHMERDRMKTHKTTLPLPPHQHSTTATAPRQYWAVCQRRHHTPHHAYSMQERPSIMIQLADIMQSFQPAIEACRCATVDMCIIG
jgi:hypothetical protein